MSEDNMRSYLIETESHSKELKLISEAVDASTNLQQAWLRNNVVFNPAGLHRFGRRQDNREPDARFPFKNCEDHLYPNYIAFAHSVSPGKPSAMGLLRFKAWLLDELQHVLKLNVHLVKIRNVDCIEGISLRESWPIANEASTISRSQVKLFGSPDERRQMLYSGDNAGYANFPAVHEAAENPVYWEEKFNEWAPSLGNIRIVID